LNAVTSLRFLHTIPASLHVPSFVISGELEDDTKTLVVNVKPGWKAGTKITFPSEGDEGPQGLPADLVFVVKEKAHPALTREGNHLVVAKKVSLCWCLLWWRWSYLLVVETVRTHLFGCPST
jgi:hypothetical protein